MDVTLQDVAKAMDLDGGKDRKDKSVYGEVKAINSDKTYQVSLNGSDTTVKCARLSGAKVGDTVLVNILSNGYAVVTGTVGGDTDASDAQKSAAAAQTAAGQAQTSAAAASTAAAAAETAATNAVTKADAASTAAAAAQTSADAAATAASVADGKAEAASTAASAAQTSASAAQTAASAAQTSAAAAVADAATAKTSAENASEYASRALGNLSTVQSVAETLTWITEHGQMTPTTDTELDPTHVYFVQKNDGDYVVAGTHYAIVPEPSAEDLSSYYVLSIDESLNNYVATHLAVDSEGLWVLPASNTGYRVLIATGQGTGYPDAGVYIVDDNGTSVGTFTEDGATIGRGDSARVSITPETTQFYDGSSAMTAEIAQANVEVVMASCLIENLERAEEGTLLPTPIDTSTTSTFNVALKVTPAPYQLADTEVITLYGDRDNEATGNYVKATYVLAANLVVIEPLTDLHALKGAVRYPTLRPTPMYVFGKLISQSAFYQDNLKGAYSTVLGSGFAIGDYSLSQGLGTYTYGYDAQVALGKYNDPQGGELLTIGNGTSDIQRSNAFTVDSLGEMRLALDTTATSGTDADLYSAISALGWTRAVIG